MNQLQSYNSSAKRNQVPIYLNVYNFWSCFNKIFDPLGIGVYHTGIQLYDDQYMYFGFDGNETGIGYIQPFQAAYEFKQQILLGYTNMTYFQFDDEVLDPLRVQFTGNRYDLLSNNCNHFSKRLTKQLFIESKFPQKIFRLTNCCNMFRCCIPQCILNGRLDWLDFNSSQQYCELQQSVKDQIDLKMLNQNDKKKQSKTLEILFLKDKDENTSSFAGQQKKHKSHMHSEIADSQKRPKSHLNSENHSHHEIYKHTTLKKGILPHIQNAHERAQLNELPQMPSKSLGLSKLQQQSHQKPSVNEQKKQQYSSQEINIYQENKRRPIFPQ